MITKMRSQKTEIEDLIYPLKSIETNSKNTKNYQKDNYRKIQEIQKTLKDKSKAKEDAEKNETQWKMEKFKKVQPKISSKATLPKHNENKQNEIDTKDTKTETKEEKEYDQITNSNLKKHNDELKPKEHSEKVEDMISKLPKPIEL